jgi:ribose transport system permease protein
MLPNTTDETPNQATDGPGRRTRKISIRSEEAGVAVTLVVLVTVIGVFHPSLLAFASITSVLRDTALIGLMGFGMVCLLSMQELDLPWATSTGCPRWCALC